MHARVGAAALALTALLIAGCTAVPQDPRGTLDRAIGGELRVGASPSDGLVEVDGNTPRGLLVDLIDGFAEEIDARPVWTVGSEEDLVRALEDRSLDLAVGGMTEATPWSERVGVTRGYPHLDGGDPVVFFVPLGENALLTSLETYLDDEATR